MLALDDALRGSSEALEVGMVSIDCSEGSMALGIRVTSLRVDASRRAAAKTIEALSAALATGLVAIDFCAVFMTGVDVVFFGD